MSITQKRSETAIEPPRTQSADMKLETGQPGVTLAKLSSDHDPSQRITDLMYLGGPEGSLDRVPFDVLDRSVAVDNRTDLQLPSLPSESSHGFEPTSYIPCDVCQREIPLSAAGWRESSDYVAHFCGLECYDRWRNQSGGL